MMRSTLLRRLLLASMAIGASSFAVGAPPGRPGVVIVHGAFADGSDWAGVIALLQAQGVEVTAVQNPLTSLDDDVAATRRAIAAQPGRVVLVGHSWGGTVITEAGATHKVAALVYVAAFAPDAGQSTAELGKPYPAPAGLAFLKADEAGFLSLTAEGMSRHFAQDLPAAKTAVMNATQGPIQAQAFDQKVSVAAWRSKPSWYVVATADHMIQPQHERDMAKRIGARVTELPTSHVPQQSQPAKVADVILQAVRQAG